MTGRGPRAVAWDAEFWDFASAGVLVAQECLNCGTLQHYPRPVCMGCFSDKHTWRELSGAGEIYSFTVVRRSVGRTYDPPLVLLDVLLDEGVRMISALTGPADLVEVGARVEVAFPAPAGDAQARPYFRLTRTPEPGAG